MDPKLAELATRYVLSAATVASLETMIATVSGAEELPDKWRQTIGALIEDSLTGLELGVVRHAQRVADLGSGSGVPGLVLAAALPHATFTLVDRFERNCSFIRVAAEAMSLKNVEVVVSQTELWAAANPATCDLVVSRNVRPVNVMTPSSILLKPGGHAVVWTGEKGLGYDEITAPDDAVGLRVAEIRPVLAMGKQRYLFVYEAR